MRTGFFVLNFIFAMLYSGYSLAEEPAASPKDPATPSEKGKNQTALPASPQDSAASTAAAKDSAKPSESKKDPSLPGRTDSSNDKKADDSSPEKPGDAAEPEKKEDDRWNFHFQTTIIPQFHGHFHSPYQNAISVPDENEVRTTETGTLFFGVRLWQGAELHAVPEESGGQGLGATTGIAGFPNGEATRVGDPKPTPYLSRVFLRQTIGFGGEQEYSEDDQLHVAANEDISRLTLTLGKMSAADIFDGNAFSHDPRTQFMNWSLMDNGAWDYPADTRGYTIGAAAEFNQKWWTLRYGFFLEPHQANGPQFDTRIDKAHGQIVEFEARYSVFGKTGTVRLEPYVNSAHMGKYSEATADPDLNIVKTRVYRNKYGVCVNAEQPLTDDIGVFVRAGWNDGRSETWAFTEIDQTFSLGASIKGTRWKRSDDVFGIAGVMNGLSKDHREFLEAAGLGFIVGDGRLNYSTEKIMEAYYKFHVYDKIFLSADYQFVKDPGYNKNRGPINVGAIRFHFEF